MKYDQAPNRLNFFEYLFAMAIELTNGSIEQLCNGTIVRQPILQLLGFEAMKTNNNETSYRLVLSDGVHMNSYFFLSFYLNDLIVSKQVKYGTILRINKYRLMDGENVINHSPRWVVCIHNVTVLIHRNVFGNPQPLINIVKKIKPLINLNQNTCPGRTFNSIDQLENNLINVQDLNNIPNGICSFVLKLTLVKKYPINTYSHCRVLNMNMEDPTGMLVRVSAFNSLSDHMNHIFEENKTYYISDTVLKHNALNELKLQTYSIVIECINQTITMEPVKTANFILLLENNLNTFCDLFGVCIEISDVEVFANSTVQTEIAKRNIVLIDFSMATITLKVWGENVLKFDEKFDEPPVVMVNQAVLKQFNGNKYFSMLKSSELLINPDTDKTHELKKWYKETLQDFE